MSRLKTVSLAGLLAALVLGPAPRATAQAPTPRPAGPDVACGPRCVQALLAYYGKPEEELNDLIHEIQWPDVEAGATLLAIETALRKRGISTQALQLDRGARLCWPHPVLLHLNGGPNRRGHYGIWVPPGDPDDERVWMGLSGTRRGSWEEVAGGRSGAVLLTSPVPIAHALSAVYDPARESRLTILSVVVLATCVICSGVVAWRWAVRPRLEASGIIVVGGAPAGAASMTRLSLVKEDP